MSKTYDVVGIGNAVVDVISHGDDSFLDNMGITKGIMQLIERERAEVLYAAMSDRVQTPGGSVANTLAGLGTLGLSTAFVGRVKDDALGRFYADSMVAEGTDFPNPPVNGEHLPTSRSMIFVSPDGERSMNTYLGVSSELSEEDVDPSVMGAAKLLFLEGYLFDKDKGKSAFLAAAAACRAAGGQAGITLSDPFCVDRHRDGFRALIEDEMDFVIGNEAEWLSLYETHDLDVALREAAMVCPTLVCTRSGEAVILRRDDEQVEVPVDKITPVDATGAGDQFAAGFLYGLVTEQSLEMAGRMGVLAAAEVIRHIGPRPHRSLRQLFAEEGLIQTEG
ncbi:MULTISPECIES: adenosine kinase [Paracoccaceae]|jgi:sugar/nucleoside kinase (ribokinase family)|uniref:adenosine kinase n=1 Tax=Rhodobacterales TaxID=204455 RepID=UPI001B1D342C|nr:adenosine kinase [Boseongicola sp. H5]MBO6603438.1 adenosine kinase [Roseicyclus sp.]MBO6623899.1 adenosine kinase [Roseicyclus sp.]MBO6921085.1 adenosine kinase [Roseicyclus sp.]